MRFTSSGSVVVHLTPTEPGAWTIAVRDTGIGMDAEVLSRLFTPFVQATPSIARKHGGSGLGLSITKRLVELMNGTIAVSSSPSEGSRFTVRLPMVPVV